MTQQNHTDGSPNGTRQPTPVPLLDIGRENHPLLNEIQAAISKICQSGCFVMGPECQELEKRVASICGVTHGVGCASGSDALLLSLMAEGIGPGDEVIVPSFTFFATASAVWRLGGKPVFVDIDPITFNLNPELIKPAVTSATRAIIPVHLFGQPAEMESICQIAADHQLAVIEDAAQAIGAAENDRSVGSLGDVGCISFYPTKNLGGFGDGGMLVTSNDELAERLRLFRTHGMKPRYYHSEVGINSRLDAIQAAVLNVKLPRLDQWTASRQHNAQVYNELFRSHGLDQYVTLPTQRDSVRHVWNQYTIRVHNGLRDGLRSHLQNVGIGTEIYYPIPLHRQDCFRSLGYTDGSLPETERASHEVMSLPVFPEMTQVELDSVVRQVRSFFHKPAVATLSPNLQSSTTTVQR